MERETGVEPATSSLGNRTSIVNKDYRVFGDSDVRSKLPYFQPFVPPFFELEQKWNKSKDLYIGGNDEKPKERTDGRHRRVPEWT